MSQLPTVPLTDLNETSADADFAVRRIICIARNYAEHAREMGHEPSPSELPFFFFKPLSALNTTGHFRRPSFSKDCQHELELVMALTRGGRNLTAEQAAACVGGLGLGLDMTARDLQLAAKQQGRPWDLAKGFDGAACVSTLVRTSHADIDQFGWMRLTNNGHEVQAGHWQQMLWPVPDLLAYISTVIELAPGDLLYTGTPAGVAPVQAGDRLRATMEGFPHALELLVH